MGFQDVGIFPGMKFLKIEFFVGRASLPVGIHFLVVKISYYWNSRIVGFR